MKHNHFIQALVACGLFISAACQAQAVDVKESIFTVEKMMKIDAQQSEQKFLEDAKKSGLIQEKPAATAVNAPKPVPVWVIRSIFGTAKDLAVDLSVDGTVHYSILPGAKVGSCTVTAIQDKCVLIDPPLNKKGKPIKDVCPAKACWTGDELAAELRGRSTQTTALPTPASTVAPAPLPVPAGSVGLPAPLPPRR